MSVLSLQGKTAIVTGASRGIGRGIALELARRGAKVALAYTSAGSQTLVEEVASEIKSMDNGNKIVAATIEAFGDNIDILVNNAGVDGITLITDVTAEDYAAIFYINVRAPLLLTKAVVPHLRAPGRFINISSIAARFGFPGVSVYAASKAALEGMTRSLAHELGGAGHTVNAVSPSPTESDMLAKVPEEHITPLLKATAVQTRVGTVNDIARVVAWLAGGDAKWVSGQTISASGGFLMI